MDTIELLFYVLLGFIFVFSMAGSITSVIEKEFRAALILLFTALFFPLGLFFISEAFSDPGLFQSLLLIVAGLCGLLFTLPLRFVSRIKVGEPSKRFHEEDAVLSRRLLQPGSREYDEYYRKHPEFKEADDASRNKPGLLKPGSLYFNLATFCAAKSNFILTDHLHALEHIPVAGINSIGCKNLSGDTKADLISGSKEKEKIDVKKTTDFISWWMKNGGAHSVGFTEVRDYHLYSHKGRGERKGEVILNHLPYAVALTVEMSHEEMKYAPAGPTVLESSKQYLDSGILAVKLCTFIKSLGYEAKAHIDGNYELICPLVASDAGLGVIGRMGLLMTPDIGPRVRIALVTTNMPLEVNLKKKDLSTLDFCKRCKKCANACPVNAIPKDDRHEIDGALRWRINSERCYHFWTISGTDCGQCMISCPYSHPDNWFHRIIRWGIKNNLLFRIIAVKLDDVFYGSKMGGKKLPDRLTLDLNE